jgi:argininosuccinate lyase
VESAVGARDVPGGTAPSQVRRAISEARKSLEGPSQAGSPPC